MSDIIKSIDTLVTDMSDTVRKEVSSNLRPVLKKLSEALEELEEKLEETEKGAAPKKKRGRPAKAGRKKAAKRAPRGALQTAIKDALGKSSKPLKLSQIRDSVIKKSTFKGRDPKTLYTMIVLAVKKMPEVSKTASGAYSLSGKAPKKTTSRKKTKKK